MLSVPQTTRAALTHKEPTHIVVLMVRAPYYQKTDWGLDFKGDILRYFLVSPNATGNSISAETSYSREKRHISLRASEGLAARDGAAFDCLTRW